MRSLILLSALVLCLTGCLRPNITDLCVESATLENDLCEVETDADQEAEILRSCEVDAGIAVGARCAAESASYLRCINAALLEQSDCDEDAFTEIGQVCAFEQGRVQGCFQAGT